MMHGDQQAVLVGRIKSARRSEKATGGIRLGPNGSQGANFTAGGSELFANGATGASDMAGKAVR